MTPASSLSTDVNVAPIDAKKEPSTSDSESTDEQHGDGYFVDGRFERHTGLNWFITGTLTADRLVRNMSESRRLFEEVGMFRTLYCR